MAQFGEWLLSDGCLMAHILILEFSQSSLAHIRGLQLLMNVTPLLTDMTENIPILRIQNLIKLKVIHISLNYLGIFPCVYVHIYIYIYIYIYIHKLNISKIYIEYVFTSPK